jgi:hypothetical protein
VFVSFKKRLPRVEERTWFILGFESIFVANAFISQVNA